MFSRAQFSRTSFSYIETDTMQGVSARAISTSRGRLLVSREMYSEANAITRQSSDLVRQLFLYGTAVNAVSGIGDCRVVRERLFEGQADAVTTSWGGRVLSVITYILTMPDIDMQNGDVLVIDTGEYTVTLNGENAVWLVSDLSEFFKLEPGEGTISIEVDADSEADIRILWRERYL